MQAEPVPRWIIFSTVFIAIGVCCVGLFLTGPSWVHLIPSLPQVASAPTATRIPSPTPTAFSLPTSTPAPTVAEKPIVFPTMEPTREDSVVIRAPTRNSAPIERIPRPSGGRGSGATCLLTLIFLGGFVAVLYYFANKTGPARSPVGTTLEQEIERYRRQGCQVIHQTKTTAQVLKPKQFDVLLAIILFFLFPVIGLVIYLLYFIGKKDTNLYLEVAGDRVLTTRS